MYFFDCLKRFAYIKKKLDLNFIFKSSFIKISGKFL